MSCIMRAHLLSVHTMRTIGVACVLWLIIAFSAHAAPPVITSCADLNNLARNQSAHYSLQKFIEACIEMGYDPPRNWITGRGVTGAGAHRGSGVVLKTGKASSKCPATQMGGKRADNTDYTCGTQYPACAGRPGGASDGTTSSVCAKGAGAPTNYPRGSEFYNMLHLPLGTCFGNGLELLNPSKTTETLGRFADSVVDSAQSDLQADADPANPCARGSVGLCGMRASAEYCHVDMNGNETGSTLPTSTAMVKITKGLHFAMSSKVHHNEPPHVNEYVTYVEGPVKILAGKAMAYYPAKMTHINTDPNPAVDYETACINNGITDPDELEDDKNECQPMIKKYTRKYYNNNKFAVPPVYSYRNIPGVARKDPNYPDQPNYTMACELEPGMKLQLVYKFVGNKKRYCLKVTPASSSQQTGCFLRHPPRLRNGEGRCRNLYGCPNTHACAGMNGFEVGPKINEAQGRGRDRIVEIDAQNPLVVLEKQGGRMVEKTYDNSGSVVLVPALMFHGNTTTVTPVCTPAREKMGACTP